MKLYNNLKEFRDWWNKENKERVFTSITNSDIDKYIAYKREDYFITDDNI